MDSGGNHIRNGEIRIEGYRNDRDTHLIVSLFISFHKSNRPNVNVPCVHNIVNGRDN